MSNCSSDSSTEMLTPMSEMEKQKPELASLKAGETFMNHLSLYTGHHVTVLVGPSKKSYSIPKALLSHYSKFFDRALDGVLAGGELQQIDLPEETPDTFELLLQWTYKNSIAFPTTSIPPERIQILMDFFIAAEKYEFLGPQTSLHTQLKELLSGHWNEVLSDRMTHGFVHKILQSAFQLPAYHPAHHLLVQACVKPYIWGKNAINGAKLADSHPQRMGLMYPSARERFFDFEKVTKDIEGLAAELLEAVADMVTNQIDRENKSFDKLTYRDPLTNGQFILWSHESHWYNNLN